MNNKIEAVNVIAEAVEKQKQAEEKVHGLLSGYMICGIDCDPHGAYIHIYDGIEEFAAEMGAQITVEQRSDRYERLGFTYNGVEVFQLREKKNDLSDQ